MYPLRGKPQHRVERLILKTHPSRPPIQCAIHRGCFTTFILFCGCVYGWILTTLLLLSVALLLKVTLHHYVYLLGSKPQWSAVVKAIDQSKWLPLQCQTHMSVSQPAYAVDVQWMSPYHLTACSCRPCFCKLPIFLGTSRGANHSLAWWLRPKTHSSGLPRQCQTHIRCFIPFICYGCAYGWILFMLQLLLLAMLLEVNTILEFWIHLKRGKPQSSAVVDSREPFKRSPTSNQKHTSCHTTFICCGMCIWMNLCHNTTALIDVM